MVGGVAHAAFAPWESDEPTISEQSGIRYLHFGTEWVQGAMRVRRPNDLVLAYTQQMMAWLLFREPGADDDIGIMGLGAGSLLRYTLHQTPARVCTVEWNPMVTAICRSHFRLPESARSEIDHCDAADWVREPRNIGRYAALMVDLYDATAQGPVRGSPEFYRDCAHALTDDGVITVNLFGEHASFEPNLEGLRAAVAAHPGAMAEGRIFIQADEVVPYGYVMRAFTQIREAGVENLALVTDPAGGAQDRRLGQE